MLSIRMGRRLAVACVPLAALAAGGLVTAAAHGAPAAAHRPGASSPHAAAVSATEAAPASTAAIPVAQAAAAPTSTPTASTSTPVDCLIVVHSPPPQASTAASLWEILEPCGQPLLSDPTGLQTFMVNDCSHAADVTVGTDCAVSSEPDSVAVNTGEHGDADAGELAVGGGDAYACGGPAPVAFSTGPSGSCRGTLPTAAREGGLSFNGG